jgi:transposase
VELLVGIDAHSRTHTAAAVDAQGREIATLRVGADEAAIARLVGWIDGLKNVRLVAVEGANGFGVAVTRRLLGAGHAVVDVASNLTAEGRRHGRRRGKTDEIDAVAVARVALREPDLPPVTLALLDTDLKLLVDARDQLVQEATRVRNRLHALLLALAPGHQATTGALISRPALTRARQAILRARRQDPVRARLALRAVARLSAIEEEARELEEEISHLVRLAGHDHLLAIRGVGPLVAAKLIGEVRDVRRYASAAAFAAHAGVAPVPASSGNRCRHRLSLGGNRQLNRALYTIALVQARWDPAARAYLARKRSEGKTGREALRCLKRHLANVVYRAMLKDAAACTDSAVQAA